MGRNQDFYVDYDAERRGHGKKGTGDGLLGRILLVLVLAVLCGFLAYKVSGKYLDDLPVVPTVTPVPEASYMSVLV